MIKVVIADDESTIHEQLKKLIPWDELGWEIVGHAYNGEEARRLTEVYHPHLVLTDIKMPLMDGLSFMSWLDQSKIEAKVIVLSGYGEFEISRSAFLLGAYDYLLKPVKEPELLMALSKAVEQIHRESKSMVDQINNKAVLNQGLTLMRDEYFSQVIASSSIEENEIIVRAEQLMIPFPDAGYFVVLVKFPDLDVHVQHRYEGDWNVFYYAIRNILHETLESPSSNLLSRNLHLTNEFMFLFPSSTKQTSGLEKQLKRLKYSLNHYVRMDALIGVSSLNQRPGKLSAAYAEALHALESLRLGVGEIGYYTGLERGVKAVLDLETEWKDISILTDMLLKTGSLHEGKQLLDRLEEAFHKNALSRISVSEWRRCVLMLISKLEGQVMNEETMLFIHEARIGLRELRIDGVKDLLYRMLQGLLQAAAGETRSKSGKQLIEAIKTYIDTHYRTVSLEAVSQQFYLNKNYFCSLFKVVVGESFMEYVTRLRIEQAKQLLSASDLKTYEIADQVGYPDQRYFSQVFRKHTGLQPTQYRQMIRGSSNQS